MGTTPGGKEIVGTLDGDTYPSGHEWNLFDGLRESVRYCAYSLPIGQIYCHWVRGLCHTNNLRHSAGVSEPRINALLTHLAVKEKVSASTQNQALSALLFLYRHVPEREISDLGRHHVFEPVIQKAVTEAARKAGFTKRATCHAFRHSFARHLTAYGCDIRTVQELLGHRDVKTAMVCTHGLNRAGRGSAAQQTPCGRGAVER